MYVVEVCLCTGMCLRRRQWFGRSQGKCLKELYVCVCAKKVWCFLFFIISRPHLLPTRYLYYTKASYIKCEYVWTYMYKIKRKQRRTGTGRGSYRQSNEREALRVRARLTRVIIRGEMLRDYFSKSTDFDTLYASNDVFWKFTFCDSCFSLVCTSMNEFGSPHIT